MAQPHHFLQKKSDSNLAACEPVYQPIRATILQVGSLNRFAGQMHISLFFADEKISIVWVFSWQKGGYVKKDRVGAA